MKKLFYILFLFLTSSVLMGQNKSIDIARLEYKNGNYQDAVGLFNGAIATASDSQTKKTLTIEKEKSSECWEYLEKANKYFNESKYRIAEQFYRNILSRNSHDPFAKKQLERCQSNIRSATLKAEREKEIETFIANIANKNDINQLRVFVKKYPNEPSAQLLTKLLDYYTDPKKIENESLSQKINLYNNFGIFYYKHNKNVAASFFEKEAACSSISGFYNLAISLPDDQTDRIQRLLVFAAANGHEEAIKIIGSKYPKLIYNKEIPKAIYQDLIKANQGNIFSKVVTQQYKFIIGLPSLNLIDDKSQYVSSEDHWQYELGLLYIKGYYVTKDSDKGFSYLFDAAAKGNYDAQERVADMLKASDESQAIRLCAAINGSVEAQKQLGMNDRELRYARAYIQYLKKEQCKFHDVYLFLNFYAYKYHCEDIDAKLMTYAFSYYDGKTYKEVISLLKSKKIWNRETIMTIQNKLADSNKKSDKKLLKQLAKISVTVEKNKPNLLQSLITEGFCTNPHPAVKIPLYDYMTYKVNSYESTPSNQTAPSRANTKERENKPSDTYYKIAPRRNMSIGEAQGWSSRLGAGWRLATASEMKNIPGLNGVFWTDGGNRGILIDSNDKFRSRYSNNPNDRAGAVAIKK